MLMRCGLGHPNRHNAEKQSVTLGAVVSRGSGQVVRGASGCMSGVAIPPSLRFADTPQWTGERPAMPGCMALGVGSQHGLAQCAFQSTVPKLSRRV